MATGAAEWFAEAHRQVYLAALWSCWDSLARTSDSLKRDSFVLDVVRKHEWFPGTALLADQIAKYKWSDDHETVTRVLDLAEETWRTFWEQDWKRLEGKRDLNPEE